jgi:hypothetical protein
MAELITLGMVTTQRIIPTFFREAMGNPRVNFLRFFFDRKRYGSPSTTARVSVLFRA